MANETALTSTINFVPVQGVFTPDAELVTLIGPGGTPFYAAPDPDQSGLHITNSTIDSTTIGATTPSTGVFSSGQVIATPTGATDIANKQYVDYYAAGLSWKEPALVATLTNLTSLSGLQTIDSVTLVAGDTVLVKDQSTASQNGIYTASAGAWTRSIGGDVWSEYVGAIIFIVKGSQGGSAWYCTAQPGGTLGTTAINWSNFSVASSYSAGTGLTLSGTEFSITNTGVTAATKGSASKTVTATVNAQGQLTSLTDQDIAIANTQVSGLGTMSTQNANNVSITGGSISGTTVAGYAASGANSDITSMSGLSGGITTPDYITFDVTPETVPTAAGSLYWDSADGNQTLSLVMTGGNAVQQIGEETYYRVKASSAITEGQVVMFTGTVGASGGLTGAPATGLTASTASYIMGIATESIAENAWGYVTGFGLVRGIDTTGGGESWVDGQILYYNPSVAGGLTKTLPSAPNAKVQVCAVAHAASNGSLFVRPSFGGILGQYEGDVGFTSTAGSDLIQRNAGNTAWVNVAPSSITGVGSVANSVTFNSTGGASPGATFNGSAARTIDYSTVGAPSASGTGASGTWAISVSGNAATSTKATNLAGGLTNQIPYQTAADTTSYIAAPSDNTWLKYTTGGGLAFDSLPASGLTITDDTTTNATRYITFTNATSGSITGENTSSTKLYYNPSTGQLNATTFVGALSNPTVTNYTETLYTVTGSATLALTNGTVQKVTTSGSTTITLPASSTGKSFTVIVAYAAADSITWAGGSTIKWAGGTTPTPTSVSGKFDIFNFYQDGTNTYGSIFGQNY